MHPFPFPYSRPPRRPARDARGDALTEWRGVDLAPLEKAKALAARSAGDVLQGVVNKLGLDRRRSEAEVFKAWDHLVDPTVALHAKPVGLRNGTLFIAVDSSVWLDEIVRYRRREIVTRLQQAFGRDLVAKVSFRLG